MTSFPKIFCYILSFCLFSISSSFDVNAAKSAKRLKAGKCLRNKYYQPSSQGAPVAQKCCPGYLTIKSGKVLGNVAPVCAKKGSDEAKCAELKNTVRSTSNEIKVLERKLRKLKRTLNFAKGFYKAGQCKKKIE